MSFLDELRSTEESWHTIIYGGFDPDLHQSGLARLEVNESSHGRKRMSKLYVRTFEIAKKHKEGKAAQVMASKVSAHESEFATHDAIVEGQQIYARGMDDIGKMIAVSNDCIHLGWVSGAAYAMFTRNSADTKLLHPPEWKKQRKKESMHLRAAELLAEDQTEIFVGPLTMQVAIPHSELGRVGSHVMDAVSMSMIGAGYVV